MTMLRGDLSGSLRPPSCFSPPLSSSCCSCSPSSSASLHSSTSLSLTKLKKLWLPVAFPSLTRSSSKPKRGMRACALQEDDHHRSQHSQDQEQAAPAAVVADEGASVVQAEIAPSVLHALQAEAQSPAPGRSLIERNLRKRAASGRKGLAKPSLDDGVSQPHVDAAKDEMNIRQGATDEMNIRQGFSSSRANVQGIDGKNASLDRDAEVSVMDSASSHVDGTNISGIGFSLGSFTHLDPIIGKKSANCSQMQDGGCIMNPLTSIFWEEKPPDLSLTSFLTLDFHLWLYRLALCPWIDDISILSMLWLCVPQPLRSLQTLELPRGISKLLGNFKRTITKELRVLTSDKRPFIQAGLEYLDYWEGTSSLTTLITVLALSIEVDLLSELEGEKGEKLKSAVGSLRKALYWLNGDVLDPVNLWEKAIKGSSFVSDGCVYVYEHALIFSGNLSSSSGSKSCSGQELLEKVQQCLDNDECFSGKVALLLKSTERRDQVYLVIAPWYWVLSLRHDQYQGLKWLLLVASAFATTFYSAAAPELHVTGIVWEPCAVTLGCMAVLTSVIFANRSELPLFIPFFSVGAVGKSTSFPRVLPSRASFLEVLLDTSCAALIVSLLLLAVGFTFWGPAHYDSLAVLDLSGYVLAPADLFQYSDVFTRVLNRVSVASTTGENGDVLLATHPFALAGLLGLNYVAFSVLPLYKTDGELLFQNLLGSTKLERNIAVGVPLLASISLCLVHPVLGLAWAFSSVLHTGSFAKDEVSEPSFVMKVLGFTVIATGIACFFPLPS